MLEVRTPPAPNRNRPEVLAQRDGLPVDPDRLTPAIPWSASERGLKELANWSSTRAGLTPARAAPEA